MHEETFTTTDTIARTKPIAVAKSIAKAKPIVVPKGVTRTTKSEKPNNLDSK